MKNKKNKKMVTISNTKQKKEASAGYISEDVLLLHAALTTHSWSSFTGTPIALCRPTALILKNNTFEEEKGRTKSK